MPFLLDLVIFQKFQKVKPAEVNFICCKPVHMISSEEGVAPKVKVPVNNILQIWLMLQDCYEYGLKENSLQISRTCQEQILKYFVQTAAAPSFNTNSTYIICNVDKRVTSRKDSLAFMEKNFHFLVFYETFCLKVVMLPSATDK